MAVDVDDDTLKAVLALWTAANIPLPPPQTGRLRSPQSGSYVHVASEKGRDAERCTGGARKDYRKVTITIRGVKPDVTKALGAVLTVFNAGLGPLRNPTLTFPSTDPKTLLPRFLCWWPLNDGTLKQDEKAKAGDDIWMGVMEGEIRSVRME